MLLSFNLGEFARLALVTAIVGVGSCRGKPTDDQLQAVILMQRALCEFNKERIQMGKSAIASLTSRYATGIGIHRGEVIVLSDLLTALNRL